MSMCSESSRGPIFSQSQHFTHSGDQIADEWYCNICTPQDSTHVNYMGTPTAQHHERHSVDHARNINNIESEAWWNPPAPDPANWNTPIIEDLPLTTEEMKIRESQLHVDHVRDMVPFWIRGVEAAEKGEVLRLELFLETLQAASDAWLNGRSEDPWGNVYPDRGWGGDGWDIQPDRKRGLKNQEVYGWNFTHEADVWNVDARSLPSTDGSSNRINVSGDVAQQGRNITLENAYHFVEEIARQEAASEDRRRQMHAFFNMPTHEKVEKIYEVIQSLNPL